MLAFQWPHGENSDHAIRVLSEKEATDLDAAASQAHQTIHCRRPYRFQDFRMTLNRRRRRLGDRRGNRMCRLPHGCRTEVFGYYEDDTLSVTPKNTG